MKKIMLTLGFVPILIKSVNAQHPQDSTSAINISGYTEVYYQYGFNQPADHFRPSFLYSHNRHHEFNLNLCFLKAAYATDRVRANLALAAGTYMNANYAAEPGVLKNVLEANVGVRLSKHQQLWLDAGIMPSHIGFESAVSKDCWTLTRSMLAENSPYFESGAKLSYTPSNGKWLLSGLVLNGWQRINRLNGQSALSGGVQLQYKPSEKLLLNYSNFIGTDKPDSARLMRVFHNVYAIVSLSKKAGITLGFDIGTEQVTPGNSKKNTWYSPVFIARYQLANRWTIAARAEYYSDRNGVIIPTGTTHGFQTAGYSLNFDHAIGSNVLCRLEARTLQSRDAIFQKGTINTKQDWSIAGSMAISF